MAENFGSEEAYNNAFRAIQNRDSPVQGSLRKTTACSFGRRSSTLLRTKTKSRLTDLPEERYQIPKNMELGALGEGGNDIEDDNGLVEEAFLGDYKRMKLGKLTELQWVILVFVIVALACSLLIRIVKKQNLLDLQLWKWEVMVLALFFGRLISGWGIRIAVFVIERNFLLRNRVMYFVYGLRKAVLNCLWLGLVFIVWYFIFDKRVEEEARSRVLPYVTKVILCLWVGTLLWLLKTLLVKVLASSFHASTFFERIQESLFNQYVIEMLSGPPLVEIPSIQEEERITVELQSLQKAGGAMSADLRETLLPKRCRTISGKPPGFSRAISNKAGQGITIDHLQKLDPQNVSAWTMKRLIKLVRQGTPSTLDERILDSDIEDDSLLQIRSECQAREAAKRVFSNVVNRDPEYIYLEDLMCFLSEDEALKAMGLFEVGTEAQRISKQAFKNWMVETFKERRALALSLNDTKTSVDELHRMLDIIVAVIILVIWFLVLGIATSHALVLISSQFLLVVFVFGNTCRTIFEAIVFLFVVHPFDVGDRCEVDGVQLEVEEMNILTTVFLRHDKQKIRYPNSVLATKPIGNYYRSPHMQDAIDFSIHIATPMHKLAIMKERIQKYVESKDEHWHPHSTVIVKDVEDMNKINMVVWVTHKMNFQDLKERWARRTLFIEEMIGIFRELGIEYRMLPLDVNVRHLTADCTSRRLS